MEGGADDETDGDTEEATRPVPVEVRTIVTGDMRASILANTTLQPETQVSVVSELPGMARDILVDAGSVVTAGDRLLRLTQPDVRFAIADAQLALDQATEQVDNLRPLLDDGLISRQAFDEVRYQQDRARLALDRARSQSRETSVNTPISGTVIRRNIELGEAVVPNQTLFEIATLNTLEAVVSVPERDLATLRLGQDAIIEVNALPEAEVEGCVTWIDPVVDAQSGTVQVRITITPTDPSVVLRPGMFVTASITTAVHRSVPVLPKRALIYESDDAYVFVVRDAIETGESSSTSQGDATNQTAFEIERVHVSLGFDEGALIEVIEGISLGDRVIVVGHDGLSNEATVFVSESTTP